VKVVTGGNMDLSVNSFTDAGVVEGTYVVEIGQFSGASDSALDVKITLVTAGGATSIVTAQAATIDLSGITGHPSIVISLTTLHINDYGGALPSGEVVDSAVIRAEEVYTSNTQLIFQIGANEGHNMIAGIDDMSAGALGITTTSLNVTTQDTAERAIMVVDAAIHRVSTARAALGAIQNRLEHTIANLGVAAENLTAAESRIRDADMAKEMMEFTKQQILLQSSMAMLAQANVLPQNVLQLMR